MFRSTPNIKAAIDGSANQRTTIECSLIDPRWDETAFPFGFHYVETKVFVLKQKIYMILIAGGVQFVRYFVQFTITSTLTLRNRIAVMHTCIL